MSVYHDIQYTVYFLQEFLFSAFSFSVVFSSSHVAYRISLIENLQLNETTYYEINYEICNSTRQRVTKSITKFAIQRNSIYYEICNLTKQRVTKSITKFAIQRDSIYYEICNSTRQRTTRFAIQRNSVLRDQRDNVIKF